MLLAQKSKQNIFFKLLPYDTCQAASEANIQQLIAVLMIKQLNYQ
jgi:hypothetical protein